jgi:hypothetical protein
MSRMEDIARACFGEPNFALSTPGELRWGSHGSIAFNLNDGVWFDHESGHGGGVFDAIVSAGFARTHKEAALWLEREGWLEACASHTSTIEHSLRGHSHPKRRRPDEAMRRAKARTLWEESLPLQQTLGERYLNARAIHLPEGARLRFHPRCWNSQAHAEMPALIAGVSDLNTPDEIQGVHRTWLAEPGRKADLETPKAALGPTRACGVSLGHITDSVLIAEGIESALSAGAWFDLPAVATLGTSGLVSLIVPKRIRHVIIAYDHDRSGAGEHAARKLATRLWASGHEVSLYPPPSGFADWNDWAQFELGEASYVR